MDWKTEYYGAATVESGKQAIRNKYIDARLAVADEQFRKFASDICVRGTGPTAVTTTLLIVQKKRYEDLEAKLIFNRLRALIYTQAAKIKSSMNKSTTEYPLANAEQELSCLDWPLALYTAINEVEQIKLDALKTAASGVSAY